MNTVFVFKVETEDGLTVSFLDTYASILNQTSTSATVYGELGNLAFTNSGTKHPLRLLRVNSDSSYLTSHGGCTVGEWCTFGPFRVQLTFERLSEDAMPFASAEGDVTALVGHTEASGVDPAIGAGQGLVSMQFGQIRLWRVSQPTILKSAQPGLVVPISKLEGLVVEEPFFHPLTDLPDFGHFLTFSDFVFSNGQLNATVSGGPFDTGTYQADCSATDNKHIAADCRFYLDP